MPNIATMLALLGQQGAPAPEAVAQDIVVNAKRAPPPQYEAPTYRQSDQEVPQYVDVNQAAPDTSPMPATVASPQQVARQRPLEGLNPHKGLFGMKGTLRDIVGVLGQGLAGKTGYTDLRRQEKMSDALVGYGQGNDDADAAARARAMQIDPEFGTRLAQTDRNFELTSQQKQALIQEKKLKAIENLRNFAARALNAADTPDKQAYALQQATKYAQAYGVTLDDLGLSDNLTEDQRQVYANTDMTVNQQTGRDQKNRGLDQGDRRLDMTDEHYDRSDAASAIRAQAAMINAKKPRGGSTPNPTDTSLAAPLLAKVRNGQPLTDGEKEVLQRLGKGANRGGGGQSVRDRLSGHASPAAAASPPVGYKNKNGLTFRGGDPNDRKNWK